VSARHHRQLGEQLLGDVRPARSSATNSGRRGRAPRAPGRASDASAATAITADPLQLLGDVAAEHPSRALEVVVALAAAHRDQLALLVADSLHRRAAPPSW
jgi:hypothetical protein